MGSARFALVDGETARLAVQWRGMYRDLVVTLDGKELARHAALDENEVFAVALPALDGTDGTDGNDGNDGNDGGNGGNGGGAGNRRVIFRRLKPGLEARIDARILEGSASHPVTEARMAIRGAALLVALQPAYTLGVWLHAGLAIGYPRDDGEMIFGAALAALGAVSLVLAPLIAARSSVSALTSLPVIVAHALLAVAMAMRVGEPLPAAGIAVMEMAAFVACLLVPLSVRVLEAHQRANAVGGASSPAATR